MKGVKMRYIHCKEQAQMIRKRLKQEFPGTKFSVRIGSGHGRINIRYTNGPGKKAVQEIVNQYQGGGFDGMIDMEYHYKHMILPDGQVFILFSKNNCQELASMLGYYSLFKFKNTTTDRAELFAITVDAFESSK